MALTPDPILRWDWSLTSSLNRPALSSARQHVLRENGGLAERPSLRGNEAVIPSQAPSRAAPRMSSTQNVGGGGSTSPVAAPMSQVSQGGVKT